jgi:hypothetical protein
LKAELGILTFVFLYFGDSELREVEPMFWFVLPALGYPHKDEITSCIEECSEVFRFEVGADVERLEWVVVHYVERACEQTRSKRR